MLARCIDTHGRSPYLWKGDYFGRISFKHMVELNVPLSSVVERITCILTNECHDEVSRSTRLVGTFANAMLVGDRTMFWKSASYLTIGIIYIRQWKRLWVAVS